MILPAGVWYHGNGLRLGPGDELPDEIVAALPADHPLKAKPARPAPVPDKGK